MRRPPSGEPRSSGEKEGGPKSVAPKARQIRRLTPRCSKSCSRSLNPSKPRSWSPLSTDSERGRHRGAAHTNVTRIWHAASMTRRRRNKATNVARRGWTPGAVCRPRPRRTRSEAGPLPFSRRPVTGSRHGGRVGAEGGVLEDLVLRENERGARSCLSASSRYASMSLLHGSCRA